MLTESRIFDAISSTGFYRIAGNRDGSFIWYSYFYKETFKYEGIKILPKIIIELLYEDSFESIDDFTNRNIDDLPY